MNKESIQENQTQTAPTLGYSLSIKAVNGSAITQIYNKDNLLELQQKSSTVKEKQPLTYAYYGTKSNPQKSNIFQFDLDTTLLTDLVENHYIELFQQVQNIIFTQKSISGKLHFVALADRMYLVDVEEYEYRREYCLQFANILKAIKTIYFNYCFTDYPEDEIIYFRDKPNGYDDYVIDFSNLGENAIDIHNARLTQGLYLSLNKIYFNENIEPKNGFSEKEIKELKKDWTDCFIENEYKEKIQKANHKINSNDDVKYEGDFVITNPHKLNVDRNTNICGYTGNDARWRIADSLYFFCKENETEFNKIRRELFVNFDEINHNNAGTYNGGSEDFKNWLVQEFGINKIEFKKENVNKKHDLILKKDEYLSDYYDDVVNLLFNNHNKKVLLQGNTGIGKTEFIKNFSIDCQSREIKVMIVLPYNSMFQHYRDSAFNVVRKGDEYSFSDDKINVCIWDQFVNRIGSEFDIDDYQYIVVDESHLLYTNQSFRNSAIRFNEIIETYKGRVLYVTATPTKEVEDFRIEKVVDIYKQYPMKKVFVYETENTYNTINRIIWQKSKYSGEKVAVFSNRNASKLFNNLNYNDKFDTSTCLIHSKTLADELKIDKKEDDKLNEKESISKGTEFEEFSGTNKKSLTNAHNIACECIRNEELSENVTLLTSVAFSSLNFKNTELINVVVEIGAGTDHSFVTQAIGRFRNHNIVIHLVFDKSERNVENIEAVNSAKKAIKKSFYEYSEFEGVIGNLETVDDNVAAKQQEVNEYMHSESEEDVLKKVNESGEFDFFRGSVGTENAKKWVGRSTQYSRDVSDYMLLCLETFDDIEDIQNQFFMDERRDCIIIIRKLKDIIEGNNDLTFYGVKEFIENKTSANTCLIQTAIENLGDIMTISKLKPETRDILTGDVKGLNEWKEKKIQMIMSYYRGEKRVEVQNIIQDRIDKKIKMVKNILLRYDVVNGEQKEWNGMKNIDVFNIAKDIIINEKGCRIEDRKKGGSKTKKVKIKNKESGEVKEFESVAEAMEFLGIKNRMQWNRFIKGGVKSLNNYESVG